MTHRIANDLTVRIAGRELVKAEDLVTLAGPSRRRVPEIDQGLAGVDRRLRGTFPLWHLDAVDC
jgi:hypothetical protein